MKFAAEDGRRGEGIGPDEDTLGPASIVLLARGEGKPFEDSKGEDIWMRDGDV